MATKNAPTITEAVSNDTFIVDNTDIVEVEVVSVESAEVELMDGLVQVNYF